MNTVSGEQKFFAFVIALAADATQFFLFPFFIEGFASPFNDILDVVVLFWLSSLIGFLISFLPTMVVELLPVAEEFPTWTGAVIYELARGK